MKFIFQLFSSTELASETCNSTSSVWIAVLYVNKAEASSRPDKKKKSNIMLIKLKNILEEAQVGVMVDIGSERRQHEWNV